MSAGPSDSDALLHRDTRSLRDLGNDQPGISLSKDAMRDLDLLDDETGIESDRNAAVSVYEGGRVVIDLFPDE